MAQKSKPKKLTMKRGLALFALCWIAALAVVFVLRQAFIPRDELDCYARVKVIQKAVDGWNLAHPDQPVTQVIDEAALEKAGFLPKLDYDHEKHYYFVGATAHGLRVKCNLHEDNPLLLRLTGDTLLAGVLFLLVCFFQGYVFFDPAGK